LAANDSQSLTVVEASARFDALNVGLFGKRGQPQIAIAALWPSGKRLHNYGKSPFYSWGNQLFLWYDPLGPVVPYPQLCNGELR